MDNQNQQLPPLPRLPSQNGRQKVLLKNEKCHSKFDPIYEPTPYTVNSLDGKGAYVPHPDGTIHHQHKDDIKLFRPEIPNGQNLQTMGPPQDLLLMKKVMMTMGSVRKQTRLRIQFQSSSSIMSRQFCKHLS